MEETIEEQESHEQKDYSSELNDLKAEGRLICGDKSLLSHLETRLRMVASVFSFICHHSHHHF